MDGDCPDKFWYNNTSINRHQELNQLNKGILTTKFTSMYTKSKLKKYAWS